VIDAIAVLTSACDGVWIGIVRPGTSTTFETAAYIHSRVSARAISGFDVGRKAPIPLNRT